MSSTTHRVRARCPVRGCASALERAPEVWRCARGHAFDVGRSGYVNLLQPGDRRSAAAGDARAAVEARFRLEELGVGAELSEALARVAAEAHVPDGAPALDVGAGTGAHLEHLQAALGLEAWATDLSVRACDLGARRRPALTWIVANADRALPFSDAAFALVLSAVGPKNPEEFHRLLAPEGVLLLALSAADDLIELRAAVQGEGRSIDRITPALARFAPWFACEERIRVSTRRTLARAALEDVLATTYRGARRSEQERFRGLDALEVTFASELLRLTPRLLAG